MSRKSTPASPPNRVPKACVIERRHKHSPSTTPYAHVLSALRYCAHSLPYPHVLAGFMLTCVLPCAVVLSCFMLTCVLPYPHVLYASCSRAFCPMLTFFLPYAHVRSCPMLLLALSQLPHYTHSCTTHTPTLRTLLHYAHSCTQSPLQHFAHSLTTCTPIQYMKFHATSIPALRYESVGAHLLAEHVALLPTYLHEHTHTHIHTLNMW